MIYIIIGTKGHFMKMFPIMKLFDREKIDYKFIHTCQHYGIIEKSRKKLKVRKPDVYLTLKKEDLRNIWDFLCWAPQVLWNARKLPITKDDFVIIHGDNESTLLGFIIGKFFRAKIVHVEAGRRTHDWLRPFPEEIIRTIVSQFSDVCFCPDKKDAANLKEKKGVYVTGGNVVSDSVRWALRFQPSLKIKKLRKTQYVVFLFHRKENLFLTQRIEAIIDILEIILKKGFNVIWPLHENTRYELKRRRIWLRILKLKKNYQLKISYFFDYVDFMHAVKECQFVVSDGGGLQEETFVLNKPLLILREMTEMKRGLGETAYLSYLEKKRAKYFLDNYYRFKRKTKIKGSPSKIVVDFFRNLK